MKASNSKGGGARTVCKAKGKLLGDRMGRRHVGVLVFVSDILEVAKMLSV